MELVVQGIKPKDIATTDRAAIIKAKEVCRKCYLSCMLLHGADNDRYYQSKVDLSNNMTKGTDNYLKTIVETMMRMLTDYVSPPRLQCVRDPDGKGLAFIQGEGGVPHGLRRDRAIKGEIDCWHCSRPHYKNECPELKLMDTDVQNLIIDDCDEEHNLFSVADGYGRIQKQAKRVHVRKLLHTPYPPAPELLLNLKKQAHRLIGHSNAGL